MSIPVTITMLKMMKNQIRKNVIEFTTGKIHIKIMSIMFMKASKNTIVESAIKISQRNFTLIDTLLICMK